MNFVSIAMIDDLEGIDNLMINILHVAHSMQKMYTEEFSNVVDS